MNMVEKLQDKEENEKTGGSDPYFGHCPEPEHANFHCNVGESNWFFCPICKIRWWFGSGIISNPSDMSKDELEEMWEQNKKRLSEYREITPREEKKMYEKCMKGKERGGSAAKILTPPLSTIDRKKSNANSP